jgi:transcriptional regulator with XRE-family HTH domain
MHYPLIAKQVGESIVKQRDSSCFTQERFALSSLVDRTYLHKVENGRVNVTLRILCRIARCLRISVYELICVGNI